MMRRLGFALGTGLLMGAAPPALDHASTNETLDPAAVPCGRSNFFRSGGCMKNLGRLLLLGFSLVSSTAGASGVLASIAAAGALFGLATVGHAGAICPNPTDVNCGNYCCPESNTCYFPIPNGCCDADHTVPCPSQGCCLTNQTCNPLAPGICCGADTPVYCTGGCCPANTHCSPDGNQCLGCPANKPVDCGNGTCCPANGHCMPGGTCGCPADTPVQCDSICCPSGSECSADGTACVIPGVCTDIGYPTDCHDGTCCPAGDRCGFAPLRGGDVLYPACCIDLPEGGCCHADSVPPLAATLGATTVEPQAKSGQSTCHGKAAKVRPFEVMQVSAASAGATFDTATHAYSIAFALGGKKGSHGAVVLKVPVISEDSNATSLSVMVPPFLLKKEGHGKADVFVVTDGVMSDTCVARVDIAKLPKSASKVPGLVTASWLRANQTLYSTARPALGSAAAAPFVHPDVLTDVDKTIASVGDLVPSFTSLRKGAKPLMKTARQSDSLLTGLLTAAQKVADSAFASATTSWLQAMSKARDLEDASLKAAEAGYANTLLTASGASAISVAKFTTACGSVTSTGVAASATLIAGGVRVSGVVDAQATATVICGATVGATNVICGVAAVTTRASAPGATAYGKALLKGSVQTSASTKSNYAGVSLGTAKVCGCREPALQGVVTISITIINICDHIRKTAPTFCLPDGSASEGHGGPSTTTTTIPVAQCNQQQGAAQGSTSDTRSIELGRTSGTFQFDYRTFTNKDHVIVSYEGRTLLDTGCVSTPDPNDDGTGPPVSQLLSFSGSSTRVTVQVMANCETVSSGNAWDYNVHCPQ